MKPLSIYRMSEKIKSGTNDSKTKHTNIFLPSIFRSTNFLNKHPLLPDYLIIQTTQEAWHPLKCH